MTRYWPLARGTFQFGSPFGPRPGGFHAGQDFPAADGTRFYAVADGSILYMGRASGYGQWIVVDHPASVGGGTSEYGHMWDAAATGLRVGDRVKGGQLLGYVGNNGESSGPHLHLSVMPYNYDPAAKVDPLAWLTGAVYPREEGASLVNQGLDFAAGRPGAAEIKNAGYGFVVRYLSPGGAGLPGKQLLPWEADDYRNNGVEIVSNWETYADRMLEGYGAGVVDATAALEQVLRCGGRSDRPIFFSADWDASEAEQPLIDAYLQGAASVIGDDNVGIYSGYWVVKRCLDNGTARWAWQCQAWSGGNVDPRINILQRNLDDRGRVQYANVGGIQCDINQSHTSDYGQWSATGGFLMALTDDEQRELLDGVRYIRGQLEPWPQLGQNKDGQDLTLVDAVAELKQRGEAK